MSKKKHDPVKALKAAFKEQIEDTELQRNYDGFKSSLESCKVEHNDIVLEVNKNLESISALKNSVLTAAIRGVLSPNLVDEINRLEEENEPMIERIGALKEQIDYNKELIKKYEYLNEHKLFVWWKALTAVDPETEPWLEWKETYNDKII
jgi:hypothetical protein